MGGGLEPTTPADRGGDGGFRGGDRIQRATASAVRFDCI